MPAALFYYILSDPMIKLEDKGADDIDLKILKALKPKGLISSDLKVVNALDENLSGWSDVLPVYVSASGTLSASTKCAMSPEDLKALTEYSELKLLSLGREMLKGVYDTRPLNTDNCKYCDHRDECMFDATLPGCVAGGENIDSDEAMERIRAEVGKQEG